ncbi:LHFPL tetraspan subfamily member 3 protein [Adelges cooleyi]|uniref:LHFPL tetraspan subfamily member 3 protein n=1 Tax=Adelges cooleyi TaxID=133065 RepID=UPI00217FF5E9|nr:LHFPL tetraspan subfamily member 3 protein [Adelges cooleyi]
MGSKVEYVDSSQLYATNYVRNAKAVGVLWGIFTVCYAIIVAVAFITPEWIGDTSTSENPARFGLWSSCYFGNGVSSAVEDCQGKLDDLSTVTNTAARIAIIAGGVSVIVAAVVVLFLLFFFFFQSTTVYRICGWLHILSAFCLITSIVAFPMGWHSPHIQKTCGTDAKSYSLGDCSLRWAYLLAVIAALDAIILSALAFILATRHIKLQPEPLYASTLRKGELNGGYLGDSSASMAGSRKSLNLQPVMLMPQPMMDQDRFSEFSNRTGRSNKGAMYRPEYATSSIHNFQL